MRRGARAAGALASLVCTVAVAQAPIETERLYLSGRGPSDGVEWDFRISDGRGAGRWSRIVVPQQWELAGFGHYAYGFDEQSSAEVGRYRHRFEVPAEWASRRLELVFEGSMTDTSVWLNQKRVGGRHHGAFTRFALDVTGIARTGAHNLLEVEVAERSADASVNAAERDADYWVFGGLFRPVYLEAHPASSIVDLAVDARHDGRLRVQAGSAGPTPGAALRLVVRTRGDRAEAWRGEVPFVEGAATLAVDVPSVSAWTAETPRLYELEATLVAADGGELHRVTEHFGFRSIEIDSRRGLLVNDEPVRLKGLNRHSFWPTSGRALDASRNRADAELIKSMHANAVRSSHYPPDEAFLDACDEIGLYVLDELPGWHDAYDTEVGRGIVAEMVRRDRNHPSVIAWTNGNEGGWNTHLDPELKRWDLQKRPVLHPDEAFGGIDTTHYPSWRELASSLDDGGLFRRVRNLFGPAPLVMPTEVLHGLWDGGHGAGLDAYWRLLRESPRGVGLFLWTFVDEAVVRTDLGGVLDEQQNFAPDGIVGPYREQEASVLALRELWAPVGVSVQSIEAGGEARLMVENRHDHLDLDRCHFAWRWTALPTAGGGDERPLAAGSQPGPRAAAGASGLLEISADLPGAGADALRLEAECGRRSAGSWVLPVAAADPVAVRGQPADIAVQVESSEGLVVFRRGELEVAVDASTAALRWVRAGEQGLSLTGGVRLPSGEAMQVQGVEVQPGDPPAARFLGAGTLREASWSLGRDGWLRFGWTLDVEARAEAQGVLFDYDPARVWALRWLGLGPYRVWANRMRGGQLGVWQKAYNDTSTGQSQRLYPELKGFHRGVRWAELHTEEGRLQMVPGDESLFLSVFRPRFAEGMASDDETMARFARAEVPEGLGLLHSIPGIGTKFHEAHELAAPGALAPRAGARTGVLWLRFLPSGTDGESTPPAAR
jgi:hypothetical protein